MSDLRLKTYGDIIACMLQSARAKKYTGTAYDAWSNILRKVQWQDDIYTAVIELRQAVLAQCYYEEHAGEDWGNYEDWVDRFTFEQFKLFVMKNEAYGGSFTDPLGNFKSVQDLGITPVEGVLVRMSDKINRIKSLQMGRNGNDEAMKDTLRDLYNYTVILQVLLG